MSAGLYSTSIWQCFDSWNATGFGQLLTSSTQLNKAGSGCCPGLRGPFLMLCGCGLSVLGVGSSGYPERRTQAAGLRGRSMRTGLTYEKFCVPADFLQESCQCAFSSGLRETPEFTGTAGKLSQRQRYTASLDCWLHA